MPATAEWEASDCSIIKRIKKEKAIPDRRLRTACLGIVFLCEKFELLIQRVSAIMYKGFCVLTQETIRSGRTNT